MGMTVTQLVDRLMCQCGLNTEIWVLEVGEGEAERSFLPVNVYMDNVISRAVIVIEPIGKKA